MKSKGLKFKTIDGNQINNNNTNNNNSSDNNNDKINYKMRLKL